MRGGFPSASTMRPGPCRTVLQVSVLAVLLLGLGANTQDLGCQETLKIRRGTVHNVSLGRELQLSCPFVFCNSTPPEISWIKIEENSLIPISSTRTRQNIKIETEGYPEGTSYLVFERIHRNDSGLYQCKHGADVSHYISVSVLDDGEPTTVTWRNETNSTPSHDTDFMAKLWPYVYPAAGIVALVIIVIIVSVVVMRGCRGKSKKEKENENQYMAIPMFEHSTLASIPPPARGSPISQHALPSRPERIYDNAPCQRPAQTNAPSLGANQTAASGHIEQVYSMSKRKKERKKKAEEEEENPVVYAALNHQPAAHPPPRRPREECSEYAAIRVP